MFVLFNMYIIYVCRRWHAHAHLKTLTLSHRQGYRIRSEWKDQRAQMRRLYIYNSPSLPESPSLDKSSVALSTRFEWPFLNSTQ